MTNREMLASKSNKELAEWLSKIKTKCDLCCCTGKIHTYCNGWCDVSIEAWLEREAENDKI